MEELASFPGLPVLVLRFAFIMAAEEHEKRGNGCENDVRGRGPTADSSKTCYEWLLIHETWPVQKVQSKNAISSSDCTTMLLTTL